MGNQLQDMRCELCGLRNAVVSHHVFFGSANRRKSEEWGMVARLCFECHTGSNKGVHYNRANDLILKERYQRRFEETHSRRLFRREFGRSYL